MVIYYNYPFYQPITIPRPSKITVIDEIRDCYTVGVNIADSMSNKLEHFGHWRYGPSIRWIPAVQSLKALFDHVK